MDFRIQASPTFKAPPACWTSLDDRDAQRFAGAARYTTTFNLPGAATANRWHLDLVDVRESARVRANGRPAGIVVAHPLPIDIGDLLLPGENTLAIGVTNLSTNRIRDLDRRGVPWKKIHDINIFNINYKPFDASAWPLTSSGHHHSRHARTVVPSCRISQSPFPYPAPEHALRWSVEGRETHGAWWSWGAPSPEPRPLPVNVLQLHLLGRVKGRCR